MSPSVKTSDNVKLNDGNSIPVIGLGVYQTEPDAAPTAVLDALNAGYRHVDSARFYNNERDTAEGVLKFLDSHPEVSRSSIFYTTKMFDADHGYELTKKAIAESLDKLTGESTAAQKDRTLKYIDLVLIHSPQSNRERRLGTWKALQEAVDAGQVKSIGVSNYGIPHLEELLGWEGLKIKPVLNQIELHPWLQRVELVDFMRSKDIVPEAYSPLTRGEKLNDPNLVELAKKYNKSPAQVLVKWSIQAGFVTLPKSVQQARIKANIDVDDFELSKEDFEGLGDKKAYIVTAWDPTGYPIDKE